MKKIYTIALLALLIITPYQANAVVVSWDYVNNILQPLKSLSDKEVRVPFITATSTQTNTLPELSSTNSTSTNSTTTNQNISGVLSFGGIIGSVWSDFCVSITGGSGLCDGIDNTSSGSGSGTVSTSTPLVDTYVTYATGVDTIGAESAFTYDDATNLFSVDYASTTGISGTNATFTSFIGALTGNADTATALAGNGTNAAAGNAILGVDAQGNAEGAFDVWTEAENTAAGYLSSVDLTADVTGVLPIANGGTNASSFGTTNGLTYFDGTRLVNNSALTFDGSDLNVTASSTFATTTASELSVTNGLTVGYNGQSIVEAGTTYTAMAKITSDADNIGDAIIFERNSTACPLYGCGIWNYRSRGDRNTKTAVQDNDWIASWYNGGYDGTDYAPAVMMRAEIDGTPGNNDMPGRLTFWTTPDGSQTLAERMRIDNAGNVGIGTTSPANTLDVNGSVRFEDLGGGLLTTAANGLLSVDASTYLTTVDISDDTNLTVGATGIELSNDDIALTSGYNIPLTASTTEWATAYGWGDHSLAGYLTGNETITLSGDVTGSGATAITTTIATNAVATDELDLSITPTWTGAHTFEGAITASSTNGINYGTGTDQDTDIITVNVTDTPRILWSESADGFFSTKQFNFSGVTVGRDVDAFGKQEILFSNSASEEDSQIRFSPYSFANAADVILTGYNNALKVTGGGLNIATTSSSISFNGTPALSDSSGTLTLSNVDALDATTETTIEAAIDSLSNLTTVGTIGTGVWQGTAIDFSSYTNATAGDGITFTGDSIAADLGTAIDTTEITNDTITHADIADSDQTTTMCIYIEDPVAEDDLNSIWANKTANDFLLTEIWGESDQTVNFDLQVDDGTPADVNGTDISPAAGEAEDTTLSGDTTLAAGEELDLLVTSVSGTPTWVSICWTGQWVD